MRSLQEVFDAVINAGHYAVGFESHYSAFMCNALRRACTAGTITIAEWELAADAIETYIGGTGLPLSETTLRDALRLTGLPNAFKDRLVIYRNWKARPTLAYLAHYDADS